ncbi:MAG: hypothetical protein HN657_07525 [Candidatus Marinimicrobia bacterium]|jgi:TolB-like protein|nr:hypothetical protein [Candidatus Neomarinimicrobiota bacterium]MBT3497228.1 hypothetical protein [Candidatus Neomarinimicrobiota bacterium]MBT3692814.1 hypothetical protein [Candidatus Neomarinimicrobiota bacterium]MBT3732998.1 hypothetical protein [Candidatus Neomarinimicrobiota bacterium]MBT4177547.1 hypothetical protein [Candidatus Neomarinimicrobiota bacterium]
MKKILINLIFLSAIFGRESLIYFYLLPFDNIQNDPTVEWIGPGLTEMVKDQLKNEIDIRIKSKGDLESIMNNRSDLMRQARGSRNFLLLGKYNRKLDDIKVSMQLIDIATWEEVNKKSLSGLYSEIPILKDKVGSVVLEMLSDFLPKKVPAKKSPFPKFANQNIKTEPPKISVESKKVASGLDDAISELEANMDFVLGSKTRGMKTEKSEGMAYNDGEWSLDFSAEKKANVNPENVQNSVLLETVLKQLTSNPYHITLNRPNFIYHDDEKLITVQFKVEYSLDKSIIRDMLTTLPYTSLQEDGTLTVFYYSRDKFNFPQYLIDNLKTESHRKVPVIQFFDKAQNPSVLIVDTPDSYLHSLNSSELLYIPNHQFSPLINFTMGGWSMQIAMETVEIPITYEFTLPVSEVENLRNVKVKFVRETKLRSFLESIL